jgi:hypothetical protein
MGEYFGSLVDEYGLSDGGPLFGRLDGLLVLLVTLPTPGGQVQFSPPSILPIILSIILSGALRSRTVIYHKLHHQHSMYLYNYTPVLNYMYVLFARVVVH